MSGAPRIRAATPGDDVLPIIRAAFVEEADQVVPLWAELERSDALRASLVAEHDGAVVGHVGLSHAWLDARRELVDVWWRHDAAGLRDPLLAQIEEGTR